MDALTNGDGDDTYDLTIAISTGMDNYEENNSIYYSGGYTVPGMTNGQFFSYSANLHSPVDVDWILFTVPSNANYSVFHFTESNTANVTYKLFQKNPITGGLSVMSKGSSGEYSVTPGQTYYYRVCAKNTGAAFPRNYTFELRTYLLQQTTNINIQMTLNGNPVPIQNYGYGLRYALKQGQLLEVYVYYYMANGSLNTAENDVVTVKISNGAWPLGSPNYEIIASGFASGGIAYIPLIVPLVYGQITILTQPFFLLYDYSCTLTITSAKYGQLLNTPVYITT